jgi:hypothetical protein
VHPVEELLVVSVENYCPKAQLEKNSKKLFFGRKDVIFKSFLRYARRHFRKEFENFLVERSVKKSNVCGDDVRAFLIVLKKTLETSVTDVSYES